MTATGEAVAGVQVHRSPGPGGECTAKKEGVKGSSLRKLWWKNDFPLPQICVLIPKTATMLSLQMCLN